MLIVAEIGLNHLGDTAYADTYIEGLIKARPDGVSFQVREREYYARQHVDRPRVLEDRYYRGAARRLHEAGIQFGVALCDNEKVPLFADIGADFYKILSKDIGNRQLIVTTAATRKPLYVSTGMSDEDEISAFLNTSNDFASQITLIHTHLSYDDRDTNLRAISRLREMFHTPVAFGSHSTDTNVLYAALAFDPVAMFFYVKGDKLTRHNDEDHAISLSKTWEITRNIRRLETMFGDGMKRRLPNHAALETHGRR